MQRLTLATRQQLKLARSWLEIDLDRLLDNLRFIRSTQEGTKALTAVVKANAYGHGARVIAKTMAEAGLVERFAVATAQEAAEIAELGLNLPIEVLSLTSPAYYPELFEHGIIPIIARYQEAEALADLARARGHVLTCHLALDSGMGRIGLAVDDASEQSFSEARAILSLEGLDIEAYMTHFPMADLEAADVETLAAYERFEDFCRRLDRSDGRARLRHCSNSAFCLRHASKTLDLYRPGLILYGLLPDACEKFSPGLSPIAAFKTEVVHVKEVPAGTTVSYGASYRSPVREKIATLACGYADGYARSFGNRARVHLSTGEALPVVGRVCMDACMVSANLESLISVSDEVLLFGDEGTSLAELATYDSTIVYELACRISPRVPRVYFKNQKLYAIERAQQEIEFF
ncbi:MAG: alanine racemase [Eubacteriales bacterium]|nr:alanine racemase [Eubacteriales bacterium]